jgi:hypothetical protein
VGFRLRFFISVVIGHLLSLFMQRMSAVSTHAPDLHDANLHLFKAHYSKMGKQCMKYGKWSPSLRGPGNRFSSAQTARKARLGKPAHFLTSVLATCLPLKTTIWAALRTISPSNQSMIGERDVPVSPPSFARARLTSLSMSFAQL